MENLNGFNTSASNIKGYMHCRKTSIYFFLSKITYITATILKPTNSASGYITKKKKNSHLIEVATLSCSLHHYNITMIKIYNKQKLMQCLSVNWSREKKAMSNR